MTTKHKVKCISWMVAYIAFIGLHTLTVLRVTDSTLIFGLLMVSPMLAALCGIKGRRTWDNPNVVGDPEVKE